MEIITTFWAVFVEEMPWEGITYFLAVIGGLFLLNIIYKSWLESKNEGPTGTEERRIQHNEEYPYYFGQKNKNWPKKSSK